MDFGSNSEAEKLPAQQRLERFAETKDDPGLTELYFQYLAGNPATK